MAQTIEIFRCFGKKIGGNFDGLELTVQGQTGKLRRMKLRTLFVFMLAAALRAEELPPAVQILDFARDHLPRDPVRMNGSLKERAPNGFIKKELSLEMDLNWGAEPPAATYRIRDEKSGLFRVLEIQWHPDGPLFRYSENGAESDPFNPDEEIAGLGATWNDLSFSFLWSFQAETLRTEKKLGRECYVVAVPRGANRLLLWIEQGTGRLFGAREETADGKTVKEIKVVSVKEFDGLWMVKDVDILRPAENGRTSLRIDQVENLNVGETPSVQ